MARRVLRILLFLGLAAVAGLAGWQIWMLEQTRAAQRVEADRLHQIAARLTRSLLDTRAAQRAYLSPGQGAAFWTPIVDQHLLELRQDLDTLKATASATAAPADDVAIEALGDLSRLEKRIREHVLAGRLPHAADLIYADDVRASLSLDTAMKSAIDGHRADLAAVHTHLRRQEIIILALVGASGFLLAAMFLWPTGAAREAQEDAQTEAAARENAGFRDSRADPPAPVRSKKAAARAAASSSAAAAHRQNSGMLGLDEDVAAQQARAGNDGGGRGVKTAAAARTTAANASGAGAGTGLGAVGTGAAMAAGAGAGAGTAAGAALRMADRPAQGDQASLIAGERSSDAVRFDERLVAAANLSTALARVGDAAGLRPLLGRLADQLDAVGIIVWLAETNGPHSGGAQSAEEGAPWDATGTNSASSSSSTTWRNGAPRLTPALSTGYTASIIAGLPPIEGCDDNPTARAFRLGELQVIDRSATAPGAIVVPMETMSGCVGVVAAELRHGRERDPGTLAIARIAAAQLAMLTGPAPDTSPRS